jgi:radical SAM superfamily enzyme YgiQ (UPF0313 family)
MNDGLSPRLRVAIVVPSKNLFFLTGALWTQRYGPLQVASVTRDAGYFVRLFNEELRLRVSPQELARDFDVIGFSCKSVAMPRAEEIAAAVKREAEKLGRRVVTVLGGEHITFGGESRVSPLFDYTLRGESEQAFLQLLRTLDSEGDETGHTFNASLAKNQVCESFDNIPDLSLVVGYDETVQGFIFRHLPLVWTLQNKMLPMLMFQGTRGCPYNCSFCPTSRISQGNGYRRRSIESAIAYLQGHIAKSSIRRVMFEDPTAALPFDKGSHMFFEALARIKTPIKVSVLVRADLCEDRKLLEVMRQAGVSSLSVGIESVNDLTLRDFRKKTSYDTNRKAMDVFHEHGFAITGLFIVGYDTDDLDTFERIRHFINETGIEKWRVSPLGQIPESPDQFMPAHRYFLWDEFAHFGRAVIDYCNGEFVIFYPKHMKPSALQKKIMEFNLATTSLTDVVRILGRRAKIKPVFTRLGNNLVHRLVVREIARSNYLEMIQKVEEEFYIERSGTVLLQEDLLLRRYSERVGTRKDKDNRGGQLYQTSSARDF